VLKISGIDITRTTKNSISIKNPNSKTNIRFKGSLYEQSFTINEKSHKSIKAATGQYRQDTANRIQENRAIYQEAMRIKSEYHRKRYSNLFRQNAETVTEEMAIQFDDHQSNFNHCINNLSNTQRQNSTQLSNFNQSEQLIINATDSKPMENSREKNQSERELSHYSKKSGVNNDRVGNPIIEQLKATSERIQQQSKSFRKNVSEFISRNSSDQKREYFFKKITQRFIQQIRAIALTQY